MERDELAADRGALRAKVTGLEEAVTAPNKNER